MIEPTQLSVLMPGSGFPKLRSTVTLLRSGERCVLVDSGLVDDGQRLLGRLAAHSVDPLEVTDVITTHLHYDHCGNHLLFPRARYLVSAVEFEETRSFLEFFASDETPGKQATAQLLLGKNEAVKPFYARSIVREVTRNWGFYSRVVARDERFELLPGHFWLNEALKIFPTPGHTPGHLSVAVYGAELETTAAIRDVLIAGDAVLVPPEGGAGKPPEIHLASDVAAFRRHHDELLRSFRYVVPGHGALFDQEAFEAEQRVAV